jgi:acyl carrier protein
MKKDEFLEVLAETIDTEEELNEDMNLEDIEEYDSIAVLSLMSMYDEMGVKVTPKDFNNLETIKDLIKLAGDKIE